MKKPAYLYLLPVMAISAQAAEHDFTASAAFSHDSNALESFREPLAASFGRYTAKYNGKYGFSKSKKQNKRNYIFTRASILIDDYSGDANNADRDRWQLRAGLQSKPKSLKRKFKWRGYFDLSETDEIYTDHDDGLISRFANELVGDRYDVRISKIVNKFDYSINRQWDVEFDLHYKDKDYLNEYTQIGLESLDHRQWNLRPGITYSPIRSLSFDLGYQLASREYLDRLARNSNGIRVPGSQRNYSYSGFDIGVEYELFKNFDLGFSLTKIDRVDDFSGYYNRDEDKIKLSLDWDVTQDTEIKFSASYYEETSLSIADRLDPDSSADNQRLTTRASIEHRFSRPQKAPLSVFLKYEDTDRDSRDPTYAWDQRLIFAGLKVSF